MVDFPAGVVDEDPGRRRGPNPRLARLVGLLILIAIVVVLVVQNSQRVTLRFWFITTHVRLIWVIVVCLVVAGALGFVVGRRSRRRRRRRDSSD
jgi:uncharacterized integral membrane protein